jgi:glycosyltransferase involved in cell wall biosynthesis
VILFVARKGNSSVKHISIVVPCYNEENTIGELLEAIYSQTYSLSKMEVIIADGMSDDSTRSVIAAFKEIHPEIDIQVIDNPKRNIPAALNLAIEASQGDVIIRLDAHSVPANDYISRCVSVLNETQAANVGGVWNIKPVGRGVIAKGIAAAASHRLGAGDARYRVGGKAGEVETVPFGAFQREWIKRVGLFNEALLTNEDYEYNTRIRSMGGLIWFDPLIRSTYFARSTISELAKQYWRYGFWKARMLRRYPESLRARQALPPIFVALLVLWLILLPFVEWTVLIVGVQLATYLAVISAAGLVSAIQEKDVALVIGVPLSLMTMHFAWGTAFLWSSLGLFRGGTRGSG